jgi:thiamine pyrophosphokinase
VFEAGLKGRISVFAHGDFARGVTLKGLKYPLTDAEVSSTFPIGVSNAFTGVKSEVSVQKGTLIVLTENPEQSREPQDTASHL